MWVPPEDKDPVVYHAPTRKSMGVYGAVRQSDGLLVSGLADTFNAETFEGFLHFIVRHKRKGRKIVLVLDNARWHHARALEKYLDKVSDRLELDFLPPYSPDLNPIERVWKLTRRVCVHNRYFATLEELVDVVGGQLCDWGKPNEQLNKLCAIT